MDSLFGSTWSCYEADKNEYGSEIAAKFALERIAAQIESGAPVSNDDAAWLAKGLRAIAGGDNANKAFGLKPKGRKESHSLEMQKFIAEWIEDSTAGRHKAEGGAYALAAEKFKISENVSEKYYNTHIDSILEERKIDEEVQLADQNYPNK